MLKLRQLCHSTIQDEGFHEIQLNGKQLVFLFIAATVVSVVIFLCGVLVGPRRQRRAERRRRRSAPASIGRRPRRPSSRRRLPAPTPAGSDPDRGGACPRAATTSPISSVFGSQDSPPEQLKPAPDQSSAPPSAPRATPPPRPQRRRPRPGVRRLHLRATPRSAGRRHSRPDAVGAGRSAVIAALNVRSEADAIAKRLSSKGYAAYVLARRRTARRRCSVSASASSRRAAKPRRMAATAAEGRAVQALGHALIARYSARDLRIHQAVFDRVAHQLGIAAHLQLFEQPRRGRCSPS